VFEHNETLEQARARNIADALREDIGVADWTARLTPAGRRVRAQVRVREAAVCCGQPWFDGVFAALDATARLHWQVAEGARMEADRVILDIEADGRALLSAERSALNFLQLLSGVATLTRQHVDAIAGASAQPAWLRRAGHAQDPAGPAPGAEVRGARGRRRQPAHGAVGRHPDQGEPHRRRRRRDGGAARGAGARRRRGIQIEVETLAQLRRGAAAGASSVLLDNFARRPARGRAAQRRPRPARGRGGIGLEHCATSPPPASTASASAS
jgi:nicotinate-nucleotide pyrophosphorylase (carboxylating)